MSSNVKEVLQNPILSFDKLESTNNYAAQLIDADKAEHGLTIITASQSAGRGQRGNEWKDEPGKSLLMSIIIQPKIALDQQFVFLASVANVVVQHINTLDKSLSAQIKYPNDIILNDKKTAGILIENIIRGNHWTYAIVGLGLNVLQKKFDEQLIRATSISLVSGQDYSITALMHSLREAILKHSDYPEALAVMNQYNAFLYKRNQVQKIEIGSEQLDVLIREVKPDGTLLVSKVLGGEEMNLSHGSFLWVW